MSDGSPAYSIAMKAPGAPYAEQVGAGALSDVVAENIVHTHGPRGPEQLSFTLKRNGRVYLPDELPFTEVATMVGGVPAWSGRLMRAPRSRGIESVISPVAEGWMTSHLQDYPIDREWVVNDLARFVDSRTLPTVNLNRFSNNASVTSGGGRVIGTVAAGGTLVGGTLQGAVTFDAGPNNRIKRAIIRQISNAGWGGSGVIYVRASDDPDPFNTGAHNDLAATSNPTTGPAYQGGTAATARRYLHVFMYWSGGTVTSGEAWWGFDEVQIYTDAADESGNASILKASTVISEALDLAPKISSDRTGIAATAFNIPAYGTGGRRAIGDIINDINAYHQWQLYGTPDPVPRPIYRAVPTTPTWIVSEDSAYEYDDAGANEGAEIVDTCILQYTDASGTPMEYVATASGTILSRVGYSRAKVLQARSRLTPAAAQQIAQAYVAAHQSSPFKGKVKMKGTITRYADGAQIPVGLITFGDAVVLGSETNPETGAPGRLGIIQGVTYNHDELTVDLQLDSDRNYMDALMERLAVVVR